MSLLMNYNDQSFIEIAQLIFQEQFRRDPKLNKEMDERRRRLMYEDVVYNISFLMTSVQFSDSKIFEGYAKWIYELLCNLMKDLDRDRIMVQMTDHYRIMSEIISSHAQDILTVEEIGKISEYLQLAIDVTEKAVTDIAHSSSFNEGDHFNLRKDYLDALITGDAKRAHDIISSAREQGVPIINIYEDILTKTMHEIGELWHRNVITVDKEHYATSVTQTIMSSFYDEIFERPRSNRTLLSCAVGSELHEMGIRMLSDLFEHGGWDTYYLGAALPEDFIIRAIEEYSPDLVALSVTMPPYLGVCQKITQRIRQEFPGLKIAVGGQAFNNTDRLWEKWGVDYHSPSANELLKWAQETIE